MREVKGFKIGDPLDETTYIGAITRKPQLQVLQKQVADAKKKGARLLTGGTAIKAAGSIHTDFERGFIKAETVNWKDLVHLGSVGRAREAGHYRIEGRDYRAWPRAAAKNSHSHISET